ncbi:MAG: 3-deoxy-D-manno-octulosonic acid transferase [Waddliaceae bacterium]
MLQSILYDIFLLIYFLLLLPKLFYQCIVQKKYRQSFRQRFGFRFPDIAKNGKKLIWIHAVSVGEAKAIATLAKKLKQEQENALLIISTVTETGLAEAKRSLPEADYHVYLPFDFLWIIKPIIRRTQPDLVILCETDFWYNFLRSCKEVGASIILVNGKLSERSMRKFQKFPSFTWQLFSCIDLFCVQNSHYRERFFTIGISTNQLVVTGNLKFNGDYPCLSEKELVEWKHQLGIPSQDLILVAGSTHDPEEKLLLTSLTEIWEKIPHLTLLLVPRHPERFDEVAKLLQKQKIPFRRYTQCGPSKTTEKVLLVDTIGILRKCYQIADLAFVGGSYTSKVGGHNIIEPSWYSVPVLFGPHMHAQPGLVELVRQYHAGLQVFKENLTTVSLRLLEDSHERKAIGRAGGQMVKDFTGAMERTCQAIHKTCGNSRE